MILSGTVGSSNGQKRLIGEKHKSFEEKISVQQNRQLRSVVKELSPYVPGLQSADYTTS